MLKAQKLHLKKTLKGHKNNIIWSKTSHFGQNVVQINTLFVTKQNQLV